MSKTSRNALILALLALGLSTACGVSEADFIAGADHDPCQANIGVCQTTAGCTMGEYKYIEAGGDGDRIGFRSFVVDTPADTTLVVKMFFKTREHPGEDTNITWYEVGCHDSYEYESMGKDIFSLAGNDRIFSQGMLLRQSGPHLVELDSDAVAHVFIRVELQTPMN